jgi:lysyl-tRNA synthetase class 1
MAFNFEDLLKSTAWPFVEAKRIYDLIGGVTPAKGYILFETGYGPSGLPHIGTFAEVTRTTMVREAFKQICDIPTKLICFSIRASILLLAKTALAKPIFLEL